MDDESSVVKLAEIEAASRGCRGVLLACEEIELVQHRGSGSVESAAK